MARTLFRDYIYTMGPTYEQNISSNGCYQLDGFPRQIVTKSGGYQLQ